MGGDRTTRLAFISFLRCFCVELFCGILSVQENSGTPSVLSSCRRIFAGVFFICSFCLRFLSLDLLFVLWLGLYFLFCLNYILIFFLSFEFMLYVIFFVYRLYID